MKKIFLMSLCLMIGLSLVACVKDVDLENDNEVYEEGEDKVLSSENFKLTDGKFKDTVYGKNFEMSFPSEWNDEEFRIQKITSSTKTIYEGYDKLNEETDGGNLFTIYITNDYPMVNGVKDVETYELSYTACGDSKVIYRNEEDGIMAAYCGTSSPCYDILDEEKTKHYMTMYSLLQQYSDTFKVIE